MIVELACSLLSLFIFLFGITLAIFELSTVVPAVLATGIGLVGLFISTALWLSTPRCLRRASKRREKILRTDRETMDGNNPMISNGRGENQVKKGCGRKDKDGNEITPDKTEVVMKSIRGIPYLIQVRVS